MRMCLSFLAKFIIPVLCIFGPSGLYASTVEGGGHWVEVEDRYVLADDFFPFQENTPQSIDQFPVEVRQQLRKFERLLQRLGLENGRFWSDSLWAAGRVFIFWPESDISNIPCRQYTPKEFVEYKDSILQFGCTQGATTYLVKERIFNGKVRSSELARAIVHERLRAHVPGISLGVISSITTGLKTLALAFDRQVYGKQLIELSSEDLRSIEGLVEVALKIGFQSQISYKFLGDYPTDLDFAYSLTPGGGLALESLDGSCSFETHALDSFISVGSRVSLCSSLWETYLYNTKIVYSVVNDFRNWNSVLHSNLAAEYWDRWARPFGKIHIDDSVIYGSSLSTVSFEEGDSFSARALNLRLYNSTLNISRCRGGLVKDMYLNYVELFVNPWTSLRSLLSWGGKVCSEGHRQLGRRKF